MKSANCPSCGAPVAFKSSASLYAVCEFCRSTLLRDGEDLKNLGRMADLIEDTSLIQIGTEGSFRSKHFGVIGRIQLKHTSGVWNEWHVLFDDGRSAWLSEAGGEYVLSARTEVSEAIPPFESLQPMTAVTLAGRHFSVTDLETACCIAGEGELPFKVESGYDVNTADLRGDDRFVTIDYSETPPLVFVGYPVKFDDLKLANLREKRDLSVGGAPQVKARAFNCPHCASPLAIHSAAIESVACESCGSIIGVENENLKLLSRAAQALRETPLLPLGTKGRLCDIDWEIIGFLKRKTTVEGIDYGWSEYLLFNDKEGFSWLVDDRGHWNYARTVSEIPKAATGQSRFKYKGEQYRRFDAGSAEVTYVVGEFYWRVAVGETVATEDYICPPHMLSREMNEKEVTWSLAEYLAPEEVQAAFALKEDLPKPEGIYANQVNPLAERHQGICSLFWKLALAATVAQLCFIFLVAGNALLKHRLVFAPANGEATVTTPEFVLKSKARTLAVRHDTDIDNNWLSLATVLVEKSTGASFMGQQEISHYRGVDDGESWSEGAKSDEIVFKSVPPGTYYLSIDYELGKERQAPVADSIEIVRDAPGWSNYVLLLIFLAAFPLVSRWRRNAFETKRWYESSVGESK